MAAAGDEAAGSGEVGGQEQRGLHNGQPGRAPGTPTESMDEGQGAAAAAADAERGRGHQARRSYGLPISFSGQFEALGENGERPASMSAQKSPAGTTCAAANPPFRSGCLRGLPQRTDISLLTSGTLDH